MGTVQGAVKRGHAKEPRVTITFDGDDYRRLIALADKDRTTVPSMLKDWVTATLIRISLDQMKELAA